MSETASSETLRTKVEHRALFRLGLIIVFGSLATTLPQPLALGRLPLQFLLKNEVSVTREQSGADVVGSHLADHKWSFASLVYLNAGTTAIVLLLLPFLPAALMRSKDRAVDTTDPEGRPG